MAQSPQIYVIYAPGDEPLLDYVIYQLNQADPSFVVRYSSHEQMKNEKVIGLQMKKADCILAICTPTLDLNIEKHGEDANDKAEREQKQKTFENIVEIAKKDEKPLVAVGWYIQCPDYFKQADFVLVTDTFSNVIERVRTICQPQKSTLPPTSYFPLDLLTFDLMSWILETLAFRLEEIIETAVVAEYTGDTESEQYETSQIIDTTEFQGSRACMFWIQPGTVVDEAFMYMICAYGDFSYNERRLKIKKGQVGAGKLWKQWLTGDKFHI